jgi:GT2 family glycosyltransferase
MKVSVIVSFTDRLRNLENTLYSWSKVSYPSVEFVLTDNGSEKEKEVAGIVDAFAKSTSHIVTFFRNNNYVHVNRVWNRSAKETSEGDYVIFAMQDEIISSPDIIQKMLECSPESRCSVKTFFLGEGMSNDLTTIDWKSNPILIEGLPGFGEYEDKGTTNWNKQDASLLSHITGWTRERWDWFGWFRNNERGHLWLDQDIVIRERVLGLKATTVPSVSCYHQWHTSAIDPSWIAPGYSPVNERQARLLEESERDKS